ncbi:MAG: DNA-processing protein DprA [Nevskiaceae bacterium]|jgi:DNA processing protein|nr:DNA-processing protein DprA [Nevskiaceae bacterium]
MTLHPDETRAWAALLRCPSIPPPVLRAALVASGGVTALLAAPVGRLREWGLPPPVSQTLARPDDAALNADLTWLATSGATLLPCTAPQFPSQLAQLPDAPPALYVRGNLAALLRPQLAIVGSRNPTAAGHRFALTLARELGSAGFAITSGLARGIDTAAHQGALAVAAPTIAVCATGLDRCYPAANVDLAQRIAEGGALVSEMPPGGDIRAWHFPRRNRIIAGLCRGIAVVEAAARSGSLITARLAAKAGREVFAVPGSPLNPQAAGCLALLREGATLARGAADILEEVQIPIENHQSNQYIDPLPPPCLPRQRLDNDYEMLLDALGFEPASVDDLVERTGLEPGQIASMILILELSGRVEQRPGARFNRID